MDDTQHTWTGDLPTYRSRIVPVPARYAPIVFQRWWCDARRRSGWTPTQIIDVDGGRLVLDPITWTHSEDHGALHPYSSVAGTAHVRRGRPLRVELELAPWSAHESDLGIRFIGRRLPRPSVAARYHELAEELLRVLADELEGVRTAFTDAQVRRRDAA